MRPRLVGDLLATDPDLPYEIRQLNGTWETPADAGAALAAGFATIGAVVGWLAVVGAPGPEQATSRASSTTSFAQSFTDSPPLAVAAAPLPVEVTSASPNAPRPRPTMAAATRVLHRPRSAEDRSATPP